MSGFKPFKDIDEFTIRRHPIGGWDILCGNWRAEGLTWDETIGTVAAMLVPRRSEGGRIGHLQPAMNCLLDGIRWRGLMWAFGAEE